MDELHARVRAFRSPPTEMNLAKQPYPEFDDLESAQRQGEANVVEMPNRQGHEMFALDPSVPPPPQRAAAKRKQATSAKRQPTAAQKALSFRQMRDGHQQPYIDELKRLEAQAERVNQLLADRKRKQASIEQPVAMSDSLVEAEKASPKKKASKSARQPPRQASRSPQREVLPMSAQDDDTEALEAQAKRIRQLLQELETAIAEGERLPHDDTIEHRGVHHVDDRAQIANPSSTASVPAFGVEPFGSSTYRYSTDTLPFAVNQKHAANGETDHKAQQEATETAQALRYLASRESVEPATAAPQRELRRHVNRSHEPRSTSVSLVRRYGLRLRQFLQIPQTPLDRLGDAVLWIVLAAAIRVGARLLLVPFPALAPVFLVLMFAPAAFAVYLATCVPKAGFVSIYRLFLIMLGLLLGGRF